MLTRRKALQMISAAAVLPAAAAPQKQRTGMGLVMYCRKLKREQLKKQTGSDIFEPLEFLRHCHGLNAGGMQIDLKKMQSSAARILREEAEKKSMFIEAIIRPPHKDTDIDRFKTEMNTAATVGARAVRTVIIPGRRYEFFDSLEIFRAAEAAGRAALERAAPTAERLRLPLAVENHKDQRIDERVALLEHIDSEFVGCCVDTGNSFALLDDPIETVRAFAPWAHSVHLKDQAVQIYEEGFLLADVSLGEGFLDLKQMVGILRAAKPKLRFSLELITRDPLKVPCLAESYAKPFPNLHEADIKRTLRAVREGAAESLPVVSSLPAGKQVELEDRHVTASIRYAREQLGI
jgi:sugar phosphate isomerase/epimerase